MSRQGFLAGYNAPVMKKQVAHSPTRIDLAGGTLDIWPLNMLVERALTVNVAIDLWATAIIEAPGSDAGAGTEASIRVRSEDQDVEEIWQSVPVGPGSTRLPLVAACVRFIEPEEGFTLTTRCAAPAGSGLGGSSALAISLLGGLQAFLARPMMPPEEMVTVARDLEAGVLGIPTGTQDHFAATFGGAAAIRYGPGRPVREPLTLDLDRLASRMVLAYGGASRASGTANWDMIRRAVEKEPSATAGLAAIASIANDMRSALVQGDLDAAGDLLGREWEERKRLSAKVSTPVLEKALFAARAAGAIAGKVCGAGGGGCFVMLCREGAAVEVAAAMEALSGDGVTVLQARPTRLGLQLAG